MESPMSDREALVLHVLEYLPPKTTVILPAAADTLQDINMATVDVASLLADLTRCHQNGGGQVSLEKCSAYANPDAGLFQSAWRAFYAQAPRTVPRRVEVPAAEDSFGDGPGAAINPLLVPSPPRHHDPSDASHALGEELDLSGSDEETPLEDGPGCIDLATYPRRDTFAFAPTIEIHGLKDLVAAPQFQAIVYDNVLLAMRLLSDQDLEVVRQLLDVLRPALDISMHQHAETVQCLTLSSWSVDVCKSTDASEVVTYYSMQGSDRLAALKDTLGHDIAVLKELAGEYKQANEAFAARVRLLLQYSYASRDNAMDAFPPALTDAMKDDFCTMPYPPFLLYALYSGVLALTYQRDAVLRVKAADIDGVLKELAATWRIGDSETGLCRVLGFMMARGIFTGGNESDDLWAQDHETLLSLLQDIDVECRVENMFYEFLLQETMHSIAATLRRLLPDTPVRRMRVAIKLLKEVLNGCTEARYVQSWIGEDLYAELFLGNANHSVVSFDDSVGDAGAHAAAFNTDQGVFSLLAHLACAPVVRQFAAVAAGDSEAHPSLAPLVQKCVRSATATSAVRRAAAVFSVQSEEVAARLTDVLPEGKAAMAFGFVRVVSHILRQHWKGSVSAAGGLPPGLIDTMSALSRALSEFLRGAESGTLEAARAIVTKELRWLHDEVLLAAWVPSVEAELGRWVKKVLDGAAWASDGPADAGPTAPHRSATELCDVTSALCFPFLDHVVTLGTHDVFDRVCAVVSDAIVKYVSEVANGTGVGGATPPTAPPCGLVDTVYQGMNAVAKARPLLGNMEAHEAVRRCNTLLYMLNEFIPAFITALDNAHAAVADVLGTMSESCSPAFMDVGDQVTSALESALDFVAMRVVYKDLKATIGDCLYHTDMKHYRETKGNKRLLAADRNAWLVWSQTSTKMPEIVEALDDASTHLLSTLRTATSQRRARERLLHFAALEVARVLVVEPGPERFYFPEQAAALFLSEIKCLETFVEKDIPSSADAEMPSAAVLVGRTRRVVEDVMGKESDALIAGEEGVEKSKFEELPDRDTVDRGGGRHVFVPRSRPIVRLVLQQRKDQAAKKFSKRLR